MIFSHVAGTRSSQKDPWPWMYIYSYGSDCTAFSGTPIRNHYISPLVMPNLTAKQRTRKFTSELNMRFYRARSRHDEDVPRGRRLRRR